MFLTSAFIALTALALSTSANPVTPRARVPDGPQPQGLDQGAFFYFNFTTYTSPHCGGEALVFAGAAGWYIPVTMQSYSLSDDLKDVYRLDFFTGDGTGLVSKIPTDGDVKRACGQFDATAGVNASTHDAKGEGHGRWKGCHDLVRKEECAMIWIPGS